MLTPEQLFPLLLADVWDALPPIKQRARIAGIRLAPELGMVNGQWSPDTQTLLFNPRLLLPPLPLIDMNGDDPPRTEPWVSRAYHTLVHELMHAIGTATGLDQHPEYLALSAWTDADDDPPQTGRYWERRPGWEQGPSPWRYKADGTDWFVREYSTKSPYEGFADSCTHITLGWDDFLPPNAQAEMAWLREHVFGWRPRRTSIQAATQRWQTHVGMMQAARRQKKKPRATVEEEVSAALAMVMAQERRKWDAAVRRRHPWPSTDSLRSAVDAAIAPLILGWLAQQTAHWAQYRAVLARAAATFAQTTQEQLLTRVTPLLRTHPDAVAAMLDRIEQAASTVRGPMLARTELQRVEQAVQHAAAQTRGARIATWRTTSANPCGWCTMLEGQRFPLTAPIARLGEQLADGTGKLYPVDYEDVWHPPLHPNCRCELDYA